MLGRKREEEDSKREEVAAQFTFQEVLDCQNFKLLLFFKSNVKHKAGLLKVLNNHANVIKL